jgi:hypothetical protein
MLPPAAAAAAAAGVTGLVPAAKYRLVVEELALLTCLTQVNQGQGQLKHLAGNVGAMYAHM